MAYVEIQDFKNGLDTRRPAIVGEPGSLREAKNAVISRGGDVEAAYYFSPDIQLPSGTFDMHAGNNKLYVFGTIAPPANLPGEVVYQQLAHPDGTTTILNVLDADNYDGKVYVLVEFVDGSIYHYYDKTRITDTETLAATIADNAAVASYLRDKIDKATEFLASNDNLDITITAATPGVAFTIGTGVTGTGTLTTTQIQANQAAVAEVRATASVTVTGGFPEINNYLDSLTANGTELLAGQVLYVLNEDSTALAIATSINSRTGIHGYSASSTGPTVTVYAPIGAGAAANGFSLIPTVNGLMTTSGSTTFTSGVTAVAAKPQIEKVTVGGTWAAANTYTITLNAIPYKITGLSAGMPRVIRTFKTKMYAGVRALLEFSAVDDPTMWSSGTGTGFINISSQHQGSQQITGLGPYQELMAIFSQDTIQTWSLDLDPDNNAIKQTLPNTGTRSPRALLPFGNSDLVYLDGMRGIRSLKARDVVAAAYVDDIGTKIDTHVADFLATLSDADIEAASGVVDPVNSRAWIAIKNRIYVFNYFPGSKVSAWTYLEPGFDIFRMGVANNRIYARSYNTIYRFGSTTGKMEVPADGVETRVRMPFIDAGRVAGGKKVVGIDIIAEGEWDVYLLVDPRDTEAAIEGMTAKMTEKLEISGPTTLLGRIGIYVDTTHFAPLLISNRGGKRKFSKVIVHFEDLEND